jgi:arabinogalactan endo-1,4-beta-galactosidase
MLWEDGKASTNMRNFAWMVNSGHDAVKAIFPQTKVIVHLSNGYDNSLFRWMFDGLKTYNARYDVIGMSLYPDASNWSTMSNQCLYNMNDMVSRYGKEVMICEVGMDNTSPYETKELITDLLKKVDSVSYGKGLGVFYWEPQCYNWAHYEKGTWNINGRPTIALDAFLSNNKGLPINVSPTPSKDEFAYGDINGDKDINSIDFALLRNYLLGFSKEFPYANGIKAADVNCSGDIDAIDFAILRSYLLGIIKTLPLGN